MASNANTAGLAECGSSSGEKWSASTQSEELECEDGPNTWTVVDRLKINSKLQEIACCRFCDTGEMYVEEKKSMWISCRMEF